MRGAILWQVETFFLNFFIQRSVKKAAGVRRHYGLTVDCNVEGKGICSDCWKPSIAGEINRHGLCESTWWRGNILPSWGHCECAARERRQNHEVFVPPALCEGVTRAAHQYRRLSQDIRNYQFVNAEIKTRFLAQWLTKFKSWEFKSWVRTLFSPICWFLLFGLDTKTTRVGKNL